MSTAREKRIQELQAQIEDLKSRFPFHSVKPQMIRELEQLEEELSGLLKGVK